ncbi:rluA1 protein [Lactobacillus selangorensis]|uniref:Pseudouridine synthase n=1 Tax=Lactobacillus selangorensis TaxID=81857 RepID=A0A0R2FMM8_9LACO|nr:RluA family pseudouridine synthase [Lactobacillus selangorensis]KRN29760.1 rluA1 protein [Lactobacillus selangorensis]KRN33711.1 rluA1 protein [Lactobacillus selangorensis]
MPVQATKEVRLPMSFQPRPIRTLLREWLLPRKTQHQLRSQQQILINGRYQSINTDVHGGDRIWMHFTDLGIADQHYLPSQAFPLDVLYETADLLIVNKPSGVKSHPNRPDETGTMMNVAASYLAAKQERPYMIHRLDMATSGALLIAKSPAVVAPLNRQLALKTMQRSYIADVRGRLEPSQGTIDLPIGLDPTDKRKRTVDYDHGLAARTHYQVLSRTATTTRIQLTLETGRTHQIRVHLAALGHPLLNDPLYDSDAALEHRMHLHANRMTLTIPFTFIRLSVPAPLKD